MSVFEHRFTGRQAAEAVGITYRQLDYWARTDLIRPSVRDADGSGSRRSYSYADVLELKIVKVMLDAGIRLESIREVFPLLAGQLAIGRRSARIVVGAGRAVLVDDDDQLLEVIRAGRFVMTSLISVQAAHETLLASITAMLAPATV